MIKRLSPLPPPRLQGGLIRALLGPGARNLRLFCRSPAYREWLRLHRRLHPEPRRRPGSVKYHGRNVAYADAASLLSAWHDIFVCRMYEVQVSGRPRLIDAGANVGLAALFWKELYGDFDYLGFEPDPVIAAVARENLLLWGIGGALHQVAVAAEKGELGFQPDGADAGRVQAGGAIRVEVVDLADFIDGPVDLLKIDIEGAEYDVLRSIEPRLELVRNLFVEFHVGSGCASAWGSSIALLERAGFRCHIQPVRAPWLPFLEKPSSDEGYCDQFNIFAVRSEPK